MPLIRHLRALLIAPVLMVLAFAPSAHAAPIHDRFERALLDQINAARSQAGVAPLRAKRRLARSASRHSRDQMRHDVLTHNGGDGTPYAVRIASLARHAIVGETVGFMPDGARDRAAQIVQMWMASPGHRENLLRGRFHRVGIGRWHGSFGGRHGIVVTAVFSSR